MPSSSGLNRITTLCERISYILLVITAFTLPISTTFTDIFFVATVGFTVLSGKWREKWQIILQQPAALCMALFFVFFLIGLTYTSAPFSQGIDILLKYSKFLLAIFLLPLFANQKCRDYAIYAFVSAMMLTLALSYLKLATHGMPAPGQVVNSVFKDYIQQNFLMAFTCYLLALRMLYNKRWRWLVAILFVFAIYNTVFLGAARSGYIVFAALLVLFLWQWLRWKGIIYSVVALIVLSSLAFHFSTEFSQRVNLVASNIKQFQHGQPDTSVGLRMMFAGKSIDLIAKHPWLGTGTGSLAFEYSKIEPTPQVLTTNAHNEYLNLLVQLGVIGTAVLLLLFYLIWRQSYRLPEMYRYLAQAIVTAVAIGSLGNSWLMDTTEGHFFVYFVMLCLGAIALPHQRAEYENESIQNKQARTRIFE